MSERMKSSSSSVSFSSSKKRKENAENEDEDEDEDENEGEFMAQTPVIEMRNVSFAYNATPALEGVNLAVADGESVCVVGPNGGGKTTLLKIILGLLQPATGEARVFGQPPEQARRRVGYMPQESLYDPQFPVSVMDIVLMGRLGRHWCGPYSRSDKEAARAALDELGMNGFESRSFASLSGGQRQRALIARALASEPKILLLDEPTANVDPHGGEQLLDILETLNQRMTILMVTHDLGFVSTFFKRVVCVNRRVVVHPMSEITGEIIQDIYGGGQYMIRHDHSCPDRGAQ